MAATRAWCEGTDRYQKKVASRLGSKAATGHADTWKTFTECHVNSDGSGYLIARRDGKIISQATFGPEA